MSRYGLNGTKKQGKYPRKMKKVRREAYITSRLHTPYLFVASKSAAFYVNTETNSHI